MTRKIIVEKDLLEESRAEARDLRSRFHQHRIVCFNLVSSPGAGKTSLLEKTLAHFSNGARMGLIAGDVQTCNDADRLAAVGGEWVVPIETGGTCHLEPPMITQALEGRDLSAIDLLFIENIGNLVCPAAYHLGEDAKIALISTVEGDDKPLKYPTMFHNASVMVINKSDLLGLTNFSEEKARDNALRVNPNLTIFTLSCKTGQGLPQWFAWLEEQIRSAKDRP